MTLFQSVVLALNTFGILQIDAVDWLDMLAVDELKQETLPSEDGELHGLCFCGGSAWLRCLSF